MAHISGRDILVRGSIIGAITTVPSVSIFLGLWALTGDLITPAIAAAAAHFVAMGFALKFAKRFLIKRDPQ